jgi:dipeptidase D
VSVLAGLEPTLVWARFEELTRIARPSKEEGVVREHVRAWAEARGLATEVDGAGNVVVRVPATDGREAAPTVVLQAHLDMVCERDPGSPYDPREGRIHVLREGDWVLAEGTTLGADNGIGVAAALAAAEDPALAHGPLELLLTVSEEQGLDGAKELDPTLVTGRLLVNLDGTSDASITVGCAGSAHTFTRLALAPEAPPETWSALSVVLSGAKGGHSGADIARGRANAIAALARVLSTAHGRTPLRLATLDGGVSRNAIPRDARAVVAAADEDDFRRAAEDALGALRRQHAATDDGLELSLEHVGPVPAAEKPTTARALDLLSATPSGVVAMSADVPGAVETSTSLNVVTTEDGVLTLASMSRSASPTALDALVARFEALARLSGAEIEIVRSYPSWRPDLDSTLLSTARAAYARLFDAEPELEVVHGGLECAVLGARIPGVQMISLGPEIVGPHAPGERLSISGTARFYRVLGALLDDLSRYALAARSASASST